MAPKRTFSIVVPVYNTAQFLPQCIESVLNQNYIDFELILVNDGSTDNSGSICNAYQAKDERIIVINQENGGLSAARNSGIKNANGEYLLFVDSDDYIESEDLFLKINQAIGKSGAEVILYGSKNYNTINGKISISRGNYDLNSFSENHFLTTLNYLMQHKLFPGSAWIYAVKNSVVQEHNIRFRINILAEDIDWNTKVFSAISSIDAVNDVYYMYRKNQVNSLTGKGGKKSVDSILLTLEEWLPKLQSDPTPLNRLLLHNLAYYYFTSLVLYAKIEGKDKLDMRPRMKKCFTVTQYALTKPLKLLRSICQIFGIDFTASMVSKAYALKERYM